MISPVPLDSAAAVSAGFAGAALLSELEASCADATWFIAPIINGIAATWANFTNDRIIFPICFDLTSDIDRHNTWRFLCIIYHVIFSGTICVMFYEIVASVVRHLSQSSQTHIDNSHCEYDSLNAARGRPADQEHRLIHFDNDQYEFDLMRGGMKNSSQQKRSKRPSTTMADNITLEELSSPSHHAEQKVMPIGELVEIIRKRRKDFEKLGHVPRDVIADMKKAGIFRAATPAQFGGDALPPARFLEMVEAIATADGSAAWVAAFASANTYIAALPVETQRIIYASGPDQVYAGGLYPLQKAERVEGGVKVSGRWKFASGCKGADWIGVGMTLDEPLFPGTAAGGTYMAVCPASEVEIIDNWDVLGMQGTGSHDTRVNNKVYPLEWICPRGAKGTIDEPLYRYPPLSYQAQVHAAVNLGLARSALDEVTAMSGAAKIMPGAARLCDRAYYRTALARGEAALRSARAFYYDMAEEAWNDVLRGDPIPLERENLLRLSATHAAQTAAEVAHAAYRAAGMNAIHKEGHLQQVLRDTLVITQHAALNESTLESAGAILAGVARGPAFP